MIDSFIFGEDGDHHADVGQLLLFMLASVDDSAPAFRHDSRESAHQSMENAHLLFDRPQHIPSVEVVYGTSERSIKENSLWSIAKKLANPHQWLKVWCPCGRDIVIQESPYEQLLIRMILIDVMIPLVLSEN